MPAGIPQIEVEFLVDENGVLGVTAAERRSGRRASVQVVPTYGLTAEDVDRMEAESFAHAREDMRAHRVIDLCANARLDLHWIADALGRVRAELDPGYVAELDASMARLAGLLEAAGRDHRAVDPDHFHRAKEELDRLSVRVHEVAIARSLRGASTGGPVAGPGAEPRPAGGAR
jgi:molecular chaperone DnaK (HSP70)